MSAFGGKADIKRTSLGVRRWGRTALAAQAATATIPIVFAVAIDPIEVGLVASLNRPGGNMTGVTNMNVDIGSKRLELLHEVLSKATNFGVLIDPTSAALSEDFVRVLQSAAHTLGVQLHVQHASTEQ
jgi:putative tryptophan/tyrosine transport system substrate-binding protein